MEALPFFYKNSIDATIWSEILQYGLTYTMQTWSHKYDAIRCEPSDVSGYLIRTSGCLIWHDLTTLVLNLSSNWDYSKTCSIWCNVGFVKPAVNCTYKHIKLTLHNAGENTYLL